MFTKEDNCSLLRRSFVVVSRDSEAKMKSLYFILILLMEISYVTGVCIFRLTIAFLNFIIIEFLFEFLLIISLLNRDVLRQNIASCNYFSIIRAICVTLKRDSHPNLFLKKIKIHRGDNPGLCSKKNSGEIILVRDRENKHKLLICTNDNGIYGWRTLDGKIENCAIFVA